MGGMLEIFGGLAGATIRNESSRDNLYNFVLPAIEKAKGYERADSVDALRRGSIAAGFQRMQGSALVAKQRVAYSNSGVDATVGTPADVAAGSLAFNEFDALTLENNAAREALGHKRTIDNLEQQRLLAYRKNDAVGAETGLEVFKYGAKAATMGANWGT